MGSDLYWELGARRSELRDRSLERTAATGKLGARRSELGAKTISRFESRKRGRLNGANGMSDMAGDAAR